MRAILLFAAITGGLLSFNSYAKGSCPASLPVPFQFDLFLSHFVPWGSGGDVPALDTHGCTYVITAWDCPDNADPSHSGSFCTAQNTVLLSDDGDTDSSSPDPDTDKPVTKPDNPDTGDSDNSGNPDETPDISVDKPEEPQLPDYNKPPELQDMQFINNQLNYINSHTPEQLYNNYHIIYDKTRSWSDNRAVYQALVNKLHYVYAPSYRAYEMFNSADNAWQKVYWQSVPKIQGVPKNCEGGFLLPEECNVYKPLLDSFSKYTSLGVSTITGPIGSMSGINDPDYASYQDYKNGITRCDINFYDPSCNKSDDNTDSGNGEPDENVGNSGSGGGSGSGNVESNGDGNGDVVGAIDRFHADNNANHKQLLDELKKKDDYSDTANKVGDLFTNGISDFKSGAESSVNSLIDSLENYAPGLKGFGLPDGFYSNSGRCVPLDMSFSFAVPMINYSVPVKLSTDNVCKFYDGYPRELLRMLIYMLTVFVLIALLKQSLK
ncbi:TPA: hypothetical protein ACGAD2_002201 [Salmonella enterica subsp. enterica serovar Newport]